MGMPLHPVHVSSKKWQLHSLTVQEMSMRIILYSSSRSFRGQISTDFLHSSSFHQVLSASKFSCNAQVHATNNDISIKKTSMITKGKLVCTWTLILYYLKRDITINYFLRISSTLDTLGNWHKWKERFAKNIN